MAFLIMKPIILKLNSLFSFINLNLVKRIFMKTLLTLVLTCFASSVFAFQDTAATMPPEETRPTTYWWWVLGVIITLSVGMLLYKMLKKDPRKDG